MSDSKASNDASNTVDGSATEDPRPGTALARVAPAQLAKLGQWSRWLLGGEQFPVVDSNTIREKIQLAMLLAETPDDLFRAGKAWKLDDLQGVPITVSQVYPMKSTFPDDDGPGIFMVLDAIRGDTGEEITIATSAANVMAALCRAQDAGWVEFTFIAKRAEKTTAEGFRPFLIEGVQPHAG